MELTQDHADKADGKPEERPQARPRSSARRRRQARASRTESNESLIPEPSNHPETTASETIPPETSKPHEVQPSVQQQQQSSSQPIILIPKCIPESETAESDQRSSSGQTETPTDLRDDDVLEKKSDQPNPKNDANNNIREQEPSPAPVRPLPATRLRRSASSDSNQPVNAVRVLFRNQQPLQRQPINLETNSSNTGGRATGDVRPSRLRGAVSAAAIVNANRRLIERQIEAIQEADSRRWNFDFRNCRPLNQSGHRYMQYNETTLNCRPLGDQNQSVVARFDTHQLRWQPPTTQGNQSDKKRDDK